MELRNRASLLRLQAHVIAPILQPGQTSRALIICIIGYTVLLVPGSYIPTSELAKEVTRLWRERYGTPLPLVVSKFDLAAPVVFYSPDHPRMYADFDPAFSPWIDYPAELRRKGFVGLCREDDRACEVELDKIAPGAERVDLAVSRKFAGTNGRMLKAEVRIARPGF